MSGLVAPFPWFGGKRRVADVVWRGLGGVDNYVEPFGGSLAVLLGRPGGASGVETVNDLDGFVANFWRAVSVDPEGVAKYADWPVNEVDLHSRHLWLVNVGRGLVDSLLADPEWFDVRVAGYWVWGQSAWFGSGWGSPGGSVSAGGYGLSVSASIPRLGDAGHGVHRRGGVDWVGLFERLRRVRVLSGDWSRLVSATALHFGSRVGVFLDPPYLGEVRASGLYREDSPDVAHDVREWCLEHGDDERFRIVLAGYVDEHDDLMPDSWERVYWSAGTGMQSAASAARGSGNAVNRHKECLWFSPHCVREQDNLFS